MVLGRNVIAAPSLVTVRFEVNTVSVLSNSMIMAHHEQSWLDGVDPTLRNFYQSLSDEQRQIHRLVYGTFSDAIPYVGTMSFPDFLKDFATRDPIQLRDAALWSLRNKEGFPGLDALLASKDALVNFMVQLIQQKYEKGDKDHQVAEIEAEMHESYPYLIDPARLKATMLDYMTFAWESILQKEWRKHETSVRRCVEAYQQNNYPPFNSIYEAIEAITGRDMRVRLKHISEDQRRFIFLPSPYLGPYISSQSEADPSKEFIIIIGVRQPVGVKKTVLETNRSELLIWVNALADDTRLQMLEMLLEEGEICAQDFIDRLQLSQSSASRHLRQLVTAGFITSRRQDIAKCYTLNQARLGEMVEVLQQFTTKKSS